MEATRMKIIATLKAVELNYPGRLKADDPATIDEWARHLGEFDARHLRQALDAHVRSGAEHPPGPGQLFERAKKLKQDAYKAQLEAEEKQRRLESDRKWAAERGMTEEELQAEIRKDRTIGADGKELGPGNLWETLEKRYPLSPERCKELGYTPGEVIRDLNRKMDEIGK